MGLIIIPLSIHGIIFLISMFSIAVILMSLDDKFNILPFENEDTKTSVCMVLAMILGAYITIRILVVFY